MLLLAGSIMRMKLPSQTAGRARGRSRSSQCSAEKSFRQHAYLLPASKQGLSQRGRVPGSLQRTRLGNGLPWAPLVSDTRFGLLMPGWHCLDPFQFGCRPRYDPEAALLTLVHDLRNRDFYETGGTCPSRSSSISQ